MLYFWLCCIPINRLNLLYNLYDVHFFFVFLFFKARAADELARRQASDIHYSEDYYHPWGLPKGNFKHRMLSTGMDALHSLKKTVICDSTTQMKI